MAEFCMECWNKLNNTNEEKSNYIISKNLHLCEGCGELKPIIVAKRRELYQKPFYHCTVLFQLICYVIHFILNLFNIFKLKLY